MRDYVYDLYPDELCHWGIKGMRWGIRRYQNSDGTLTTAGKKRYNKEMAKVRAEQKVLKNKEATKAKMDKLNAMKSDVAARKKALEPESESKKKLLGKKTSEPASKSRSIKDMSNEELLAITRRNQIEANYIRSNKTLAELKPAQISKGKQLVNNLSKSLTPAMQQAGKKLLTDYMEKEGKKLLGIKEDESKALQKEVNLLNLKKQKKEYTEYLNDSTVSKLKKENDEYQARKQNEEYKEYFSDTAKAAREHKADVDAYVSEFKSAAQVMTNAKIINEGRKYFEEEYKKQQANGRTGIE